MPLAMPPNPPAELKAGPIRLVFVEKIEVEPGGPLVPYYHFKVIDKSGTQVGHINFKQGDTQHITLCAGHIGYEIAELFRGNSYAYYACLALQPFVRSFYDKVIITCDPQNIASRTVIEKLNVNFLGEIEVPPQDPSYQGGARRKRRYCWNLG